MERAIPILKYIDVLKIEKWDPSNQMYLMIMKTAIPKSIPGSITKSKSDKKWSNILLRMKGQRQATF